MQEKNSQTRILSICPELSHLIANCHFRSRTMLGVCGAEIIGRFCVRFLCAFIFVAELQLSCTVAFTFSLESTLGRSLFAAVAGAVCTLLPAVP